MRIRLKLTTGFLTVAVFVGILAYVSHFTMRGIERRWEQMLGGSIVEVVDVSHMITTLSEVNLIASNLVIWMSSGDPAMLGTVKTPPDRIRQVANEVRKKYDQFQRSLDRSRRVRETVMEQVRQGDPDKTIHDGARRSQQVLAEIEAEFNTYAKLMGELLIAADHGNQQATVELRGRLAAQHSDVLLPLLAAYQSAAEAGFTRGIRSTERNLAQLRTTNSIAALVAALVALGLGLYFAQTIGRPIAQLRKTATRFGQGNLDCRIDMKSRDEIGQLARAFNQMATDLQATTVSKAYVDQIFSSMREMLFVINTEQRIEMVNDAVWRELEVATDQLIGKSLSAICDPEDAAKLDTHLRTHSPKSFECRLMTRTTERIPVYCTLGTFDEHEGNGHRAVMAAVNIAELKATQDKLRASLSEKEILLKELHHRVKNNLQVILSLLSLQQGELQDAESRQALRQCCDRIRSMAMIHEQLYREEDWAGVEFSRYVQQLADHYAQSLGIGGQVHIRVSAEAKLLPVDVAVPCGMIVNELITNALKYAFPDGRDGDIEINLLKVKDGGYELNVCDNGIGIEGTQNAQRTASLGMKVVEALVRQLGGSMTVTSAGGTSVSIFLDPARVEQASDG